MDGLDFGLIVGLFVSGAIIYGSWLRWRDRSTDRQPGESTSLVESYSSRASWRWYERLVLFVAGASLGSFVFFGALDAYLSPSKRPFGPDVLHGYTHLFKTKYGSVYGTYVEYLAVTYGVWMAWGVAAASVALIVVLEIDMKPRTFPLQIFAATAISIVLYYLFWRTFNYVAPS